VLACRGVYWLRPRPRPRAGSQRFSAHVCVLCLRGTRRERIEVLRTSLRELDACGLPPPPVRGLVSVWPFDTTTYCRVDRASWLVIQKSMCNLQINDTRPPGPQSPMPNKPNHAKNTRYRSSRPSPCRRRVCVCGKKNTHNKGETRKQRLDSSDLPFGRSPDRDTHAEHQHARREPTHAGGKTRVPASPPPTKHYTYGPQGHRDSQSHHPVPHSERNPLPDICR